ncbi:hypothetical protein DL95DRAFT_386825 [Leptodontidium sp. 2 PMI_412]|nr:hypothetical protein DL95DRAFT_386825 [Leptodontidium sp. 2 PMI_412]
MSISPNGMPFALTFFIHLCLKGAILAGFDTLSGTTFALLDLTMDATDFFFLLGVGVAAPSSLGSKLGGHGRESTGRPSLVGVLAGIFVCSCAIMRSGSEYVSHVLRTLWMQN